MSETIRKSGCPASSVDGRIACSRRERLQAFELRCGFDGSATSRRDRRPYTRREQRRRRPARCRARSSRTSSVFASMRKTLPSTALATQSAPSPNAMPLAERPAAIVCVCTGGPGWIRQTVPVSGSPTHTDDAPTAIGPESGVASGIGCVDFQRVWIDAQHASSVRSPRSSRDRRPEIRPVSRAGRRAEDLVRDGSSFRSVVRWPADPDSAVGVEDRGVVSEGSGRSRAEALAAVLSQRRRVERRDSHALRRVVTAFDIAAQSSPPPSASAVGVTPGGLRERPAAVW